MLFRVCADWRCSLSCFYTVGLKHLLPWRHRCLPSGLCCLLGGLPPPLKARGLWLLHQHSLCCSSDPHVQHPAPPRGTLNKMAAASAVPSGPSPQGRPLPSLPQAGHWLPLCAAAAAATKWQVDSHLILI